MKFKELENRHNEESVIIVGAGGTIKKYEKYIKDYIKDNNYRTIGINNITSFIIPDYHLWTNTGRIKEFGHTINKKSKVILSYKFKKDIINTVYKKTGIESHITLEYEDKEGVKLDYMDGKVYGYFRTAGCMSIFLAHIMGFKNIYIIGMDGYTYYGKNNVSGQHFYEDGFTDTEDYKIIKEKDDLVYSGLKEMKNYGVKFNLITPTVFTDYYNKQILEIPNDSNMDSNT